MKPELCTCLGLWQTVSEASAENLVVFVPHAFSPQHSQTEASEDVTILIANNLHAATMALTEVATIRTLLP